MLRQAEQPGNKQGDEGSRDQVHGQVRGAAAQHHTAYAQPLQLLGQGGKAPVLFAQRAGKERPAVEHGLLDYQEERRGNEEDGVGEGPVIRHLFI